MKLQSTREGVMWSKAWHQGWWDRHRTGKGVGDGVRGVCGTTAREQEVQRGLAQAKSRRWNVAG